MSLFCEDIPARPGEDIVRSGDRYRIRAPDRLQTSAADRSTGLMSTLLPAAPSAGQGQPTSIVDEDARPSSARSVLAVPSMTDAPAAAISVRRWLHCVRRCTSTGLACGAAPVDVSPPAHSARDRGPVGLGGDAADKLPALPANVRRSWLFRPPLWAGCFFRLIQSGNTGPRFLVGVSVRSEG